MGSAASGGRASLGSAVSSGSVSLGGAAPVRTQAIIQARMGSTRLPGKVLMDLAGRPALYHVVSRLSRARLIDRVVVATSDQPEDDAVAEAARAFGAVCVRGSSGDVLARFVLAADEFPCDAVVRVTADCPMIDPGLCDETVDAFWSSGVRYMSNAHPEQGMRTFPRGLDCEVFSRELLAEAAREATAGYEREHVTPYMYWKNASVGYFRRSDGASRGGVRWTLDTRQDYALLSAIFGELCERGQDAVFGWRDALAVYDRRPELAALNADVEQKPTRGG